MIEQVKGALAQKDGISTDSAFERIRRQARRPRRRIVDVANDILGERPSA